MAANLPRSIFDAVPARINAELQEFPPIDDELRLLHAKALVYESPTWIAAMIGSSNLTEAGLGLRRGSGHRELNVWFGCSTSAPEAQALRNLAVEGTPLDPDSIDCWQEGEDDDELQHPPPPGIMGLLLITGGGRLVLEIELDAEHLPDEWEIALPNGPMIGGNESWQAAGRPARYLVALESEQLPQAITVHWVVEGVHHSSAYPVNVSDPSALPPVEELRHLSADVLLNVLASTRPIHQAMAYELRRLAERQNTGFGGDEVLDALKRFDNSGLLLQRTRHVSDALWGLERRLGRPAASLEALEWRLAGVIGPTALATRLVEEADEQRLLEGEARFVIAELALTVARIDWRLVARTLSLDEVMACVRRTLAELQDVAADLAGTGIGPLDDYLDEVFSDVAL